MKNTWIRVRMKKLWSSKKKLLFENVSICRIFRFLDFQVSILRKPFLSPHPISLSHPCYRTAGFSGRFLFPPATLGHKIRSNLFISSSSLILYPFLTMNWSVGGEIKERSLSEIAKIALACRWWFRLIWPWPHTGLESSPYHKLNPTSLTPIGCRTAANRKVEFPATTSFRGKSRFFTLNWP